MQSDNIYLEYHVPKQWQRSWTAYRKNSLAMFGLWCLAFLLLVTLLAPWLTPYSVQQQHDILLMPPSWDGSGHIEFFLGTDDLGRDLLSRLILGSRLTFGYAIVIAFAAAIVGCLIGVVAGITKGLISSVLNHILDTLLSIPSLLLAVIVVAFFGVGEVNILLAIWLTLIPRFIRALYIAVHTEAEKDYVLAARLDGANNSYLLYHSILPNVLPVIVQELTRAISIAILDIAALGFLGLGAQAPSPEWGAMMGDAIDLIYAAPWTVSIPGFAIMFSVLVINLVGDGLRQAINAGTE
ncbi:Peptide transport system permease protein SapC [Vibrio stylophorae]|uniref:Peptide transport system permease protein SapC n=1 Tax=Vibrio stylophorae TaxID=659351 RepID=A0ABM8ZTY8_9VIBR|nr:putrescine export ABC transporter permease SapC [Vibrio stylophorae]CAH0533778.1 Peptide transport system permease protein SapC [Vibrio stylophorae]